MFYKIEKIETLENQILKIFFKDGSIKYYDVKIAIKKVKELEKLKSQDFFKNAKVSVGGYAVEWNNELDISCNELYINGKTKQ